MAKGFPIVIVEQGGVPFVQVTENAPIATVAEQGLAVRLVESNAPPLIIEIPEGGE
jgi:hypothetical protein